MAACFFRWSLLCTTVAHDMLLYQKKKKTWQCFDGKRSKAVHRALDKKVALLLLLLLDSLAALSLQSASV